MRAKTFAIWAIAGLLAAAAPAAGQAVSGKTGQAVSGKDGNAVSDDAIIDNVRIKLAADPVVKGGALSVDSKGGVVTLAGTVDQQKQKDKATKLAKRVKGVKQVVNEIVVKKFTER